MHIRFRGLWLHRDFVRLWTGETVSIFGSLVGALALQFTAVAYLDASAVQVAILAACSLVPGFVEGLVAGVLVDRLRHRPVMIAADIGRSAALATVPVAALFDLLTVWQLFAVALVTSGLTVFFNLAYQAHLPVLVGRDHLVEANAKLAASAAVAETSAFSAGGWLVALLSAPGAMLIDAFSFVASAAFISRIRTSETPRRSAPPAAATALLEEAKAGLGFTFRQPILRTLVWMAALESLAQQMIGVTYLIYLNREVGFNAGTLGLIFAVGGITSFTSSLLIDRATKWRGLGPGMGLAAAGVAAGSAGMPLATDVSVLAVIFLVANQVVTDPSATFFQVGAASVRQAVVPEGWLGRVGASLQFVRFGAAIAGIALAAAVTEHSGARTTLWLAVGIHAATVIVLVASPLLRVRSISELEPAPPDSEREKADPVMLS